MISGSFDNTAILWDIIGGKAIKTITNHKKAVRSMAIHPTEYTFVTAAADNIKVFKCPDGEFLRNVSGHNSIINSIDINDHNVMASAADNGSLFFWDWKSGYNF